MLKLTFTKTPQEKSPAYGQSWSHTVDAPDADMMREYESLSPRSQFVYEYGWKQKLNDGTSGCTTESAFVGQLDKNRDSVVNGTVRGRTDAIVEKKTPLELEIIKLAGEKVDAVGKKRTAVERTAVINVLMRHSYPALAVEAQTRLDNAAGTKQEDDAAVIAELVAAGLLPAPEESAKPEAPAKHRKAA